MRTTLMVMRDSFGREIGVPPDQLVAGWNILRNYTHAIEGFCHDYGLELYEDLETAVSFTFHSTKFSGKATPPGRLTKKI